MRKHLIVLAILGSALSACAPAPGQPGFLQTQSGRAIAGGLAGAAIADAADENALTGAAAGALVGAVTCGIPGLPPCEGI